MPSRENKYKNYFVTQLSLIDKQINEQHYDLALSKIHSLQKYYSDLELNKMVASSTLMELRDQLEKRLIQIPAEFIS